MRNGILVLIFVKARVAMINDDVVKCPLCGGFTHIENAELLEALKQPRVREQIEKYIAELLKSPVDELSAVGDAGAPGFPEGCAQLESVHADVAAQPERVITARGHGDRGTTLRSPHSVTAITVRKPASPYIQISKGMEAVRRLCPPQGGVPCPPSRRLPVFL